MSLLTFGTEIVEIDAAAAAASRPAGRRSRHNSGAGLVSNQAGPGVVGFKGF